MLKVTDPHHFIDARIRAPADVVIISESQSIPRMVDVNSLHRPFEDDAGRLLTKAIAAVKAEKNTNFAELAVGRTYAVLCSGEDPNKKTADRCSGFLSTSLETACRGDKTPTILAMGLTAVKALGIKAQSLKAVQSRVLPGVMYNNRLYNVVVTISAKQLAAMAGFYNTFYTDLRRAFEIADTQVLPTAVSIEELTKDYLFPLTVEDVRKTCELVLAYTENGVPPDEWSIAFDTETNTKFPHRDSLRVLCVSFAWADGKACAIPLWHPETPYDPELAVPYVRQLVESLKPKILHHLKFDNKVCTKLGWSLNHIKWDSMLGEHLNEEDKKGLYGLKEITRSEFPGFAHYADVLHAMLTKEEGDTQLDNIRKKRKKAADADVAALNTSPKKKKLTRVQKRNQDGGFEKIHLMELLRYAAIDTDMTRRIAVRQVRKAIAEDQRIHARRAFMSRDRMRRYPVPHLCTTPNPIRHLMESTAIPLAKELGKMEYRGIRVDRPYLRQLQSDLETVVVTAENALYEISGKTPETLKLNSPASVAKVLFSDGFIHPGTGERTFYPPVSFTNKGQMQTTEKVLNYLTARYECPFSAKKLIYSKAFKAKNTFCQNVWDLSELDGYLHTNYNQHGTATYRLSSNDENMQNVPAILAGKNIKKSFIPDDDSYAFVNADAKSAEVRILTAYSPDEALIRSLREGLDTHCFIASKVVMLVRTGGDAKARLESMNLDDDRPLTYTDFAAAHADKITDRAYAKMLKKFRTAVKRVVFGVLYGAGPRKIAETIGISYQQARMLIDLIYSLFPSIPQYMEKTKWELDQLGFVETYFGRRRRFNVKGATGYIKSRAQRQGINFKIQCTSSDIVLARLVECTPVLERDLRGRMLLTVHDSLGFQIPKKYLSQLPDFIKYHLETRSAETCPWLPVAFEWDFEVGENYGELIPYDAYMEGLREREAMSEVDQAYTEEDVRTELANVDAGGA